ncbi:hypothetical protein DERP_006851 [Dermatophagoides pteronyssinus]|uniref:Uncharacterized protein n=1 Tax=Dermatophagoides pteronyssinus TaxID=6956 RepID=A0ABQ8IS62_DERPT|nr:hypothetical protein DERP_006851 [Dermatophagoides pteronyssinus]
MYIYNDDDIIGIIDLYREKFIPNEINDHENFEFSNFGSSSASRLEIGTKTGQSKVQKRTRIRIK